MAQLPPKIPSVGSEWPPAFPHQRAPSAGPLFSGAAAVQQTSWVDEFLDFSSVKRSAHRRSASDSIAFLEVEECRSSSGGMRPEFERLDDEQLMSMFSDDIAAGQALVAAAGAMSTSSPSSPSDHNSINDDKPAPSSCEQQQPQRNETEVQSACKSDAPALAPTTADDDSIIDPKRVKRILANRQSAQRSRVRKLQYISELERSVTSLQTEVSALSPRVAFLDHQRLVLNVDNSALKQRIAALAQDKIFKDAHQEALKREIDRLRQVYHQQNVKKMETAQQQQQQQEQPQLCPKLCSDGDDHQLLN